MGKRFEASEQNFAEDKAIHSLCSVMKCAKLSFMSKNFKKLREVMVLNFFNLVLKRYWKTMENDFSKCVGTLSVLPDVLLSFERVLLSTASPPRYRGRCWAAVRLSHRPEPSGRVVRGESMDWTVEDDMVDGLFCATLAGRKPDVLIFRQIWLFFIWLGGKICVCRVADFWLFRNISVENLADFCTKFRAVFGSWKSCKNPLNIVHCRQIHCFWMCEVACTSASCFSLTKTLCLVSLQHERYFVVKCGGDSLVWNQYSHRVDAELAFYIYRFPILFLEVFWEQH